MRKGRRNFLVAAVVVVLAIVGAMAYFMPGYLPVVPGAVVTDPTTHTINKGEYLARAGDCISCHTRPGGRQRSGCRYAFSRPRCTSHEYEEST